MRTIFWSLVGTTLVSASEESFVSIPLVPHHVVKARRLQETGLPVEKVTRPHQYQRRRLDVPPGEQVAQLFQGYGTHYVDLWCGTPHPQRQTVIVDTGSGVTAFPCDGCSKCGVPTYHIDELYQPGQSDTFEKLTCNQCLRGHCPVGGVNECKIGMSYQEGSSWSAYEAMDSCYVGGLHTGAVTTEGDTQSDWDPHHAAALAFDLKFGCETSLTGLFITQLADGIMGMDNANAAFWQQMYNAGKISKRVFSLCFDRNDHVDKKGTDAGAMTLGGADPRMQSSAMVYVSSSDGDGFFGVHVRKIYLRPGGGGLSARSEDSDLALLQLGINEQSLNHGGIIVDSGTTDTYFSRSMSSAFKSAYKQMTGKDYNHNTVKLDPSELKNYPTIIFQLSGDVDRNRAVTQSNPDLPINNLAGDLDPDNPYDVLIAMPPEHYFEYDEDSGKYEARFYTDEGSGGVLGANAMMGHNVLFDIENGVIGWSEANCNYDDLLQEFYGGSPSSNHQPTGDTSRIEPEDHSPAKDPKDTTETNPGEQFPPAASEPTIPDNAFCTTLKCQVSFLLAVVGAVTLVAVRMLRRVPDAIYEPAGLELQETTASQEDFGDGDFNTIRYRDEAEGELA